jgi:hypothetical protein
MLSMREFEWRIPCLGTSSRRLAIHSQIDGNTRKPWAFEASEWIQPSVSSVLDPKREQQQPPPIMRKNDIHHMSRKTEQRRCCEWRRKDSTQTHLPVLVGMHLYRSPLEQSTFTSCTLLPLHVIPVPLYK